MNNRSILYFLEKANDDLLPSDAMVSNIANKEWYLAVKPFFNDLLWEYYSDRIVFIDNRFKCDDDANTLINKIKKSFAILLKTKDYTFEKMYNVTQLEYNPIWNVDGVVGTIHETTGNESIGTTHTGSDTTSHTGDDTLKHTGNDTIEHKGTDTDAKTGTEKFDTTNDGDTTETDTKRYTSTYDSVDWTPPTEFPSSHDNVINTEKKHDTTTFNTSDTTTYNSSEKTTYLSDEKTQYNSDIEVTYDSSNDTSKKDFRRDLDLMIRQGNIGVTMTQDMMKKEMEVALFDFYKTVVHECVNTCTYAID
jgi:hypothetical protein